METCCRSVLAESPDDLKARAYLGASQALSELSEGSTAWRREALVGLAMGLSGEMAEALQAARKALVAGAPSSGALVFVQRLARLAARSGDVPEVERFCRRWAAEEVEDEWPHLLLAHVYEAEGDVGKARVPLLQALSLAPMNPTCHVVLGWMDMGRLPLDEVEMRFRQALHFDSQDCGALAGLAEVERVRGRPEDALKMAHDSVRGGGPQAHGRHVLAEILVQMGKPGEAQRQYEAILRLDPLDASALHRLAVLQELQGIEAEASWRRFLQVEAHSSPRAWLARNGLVELDTQKLPWSGRQPAWSPDGRKLVMVRERDGSDRIVIQPMDSPTDALEVKLGLTGRIGSVCWSPDGRLLAMDVSEGGGGMEGIYLKDLTNDRPAWRLVESPALFPRFSPGGLQILWSVRDPPGCQVTDLAGETVLRRTPVSAADWSPDGSLIVGAQEYSGQRSDLWVYRLERGKAVRRLTREHRNFMPRYHPLGHAIVFCRTEPGGVTGWCAASCDAAGSPVAVMRPPGTDCPGAFAWSPEGQQGVIQPGGTEDLWQVRWGGLSPKPFELAVDLNAGRLTVTVQNLASRSAQADVSFRVYDQESFQIQAWRAEGRPAFIPGNNAHSWGEFIEPEAMVRGHTARVEAVRSDGLRSVLLWRMPSARD
ncbi:MAG: PD40 domain-containing protein [Planctomycetes bacterium]|nr:PD40 domain-containing protein [Planctomycetota bacterium]